MAWFQSLALRMAADASAYACTDGPLTMAMAAECWYDLGTALVNDLWCRSGTCGIALLSKPNLSDPGIAPLFRYQATAAMPFSSADP